jgi:hypothetical protein
MIKKFVSVATATLLLVTGLSVIIPAPASANNSLANLSIINPNSSQAIPEFNTANLQTSLTTSSNELDVFPSAVSPATIIEMKCNDVVFTNANDNCALTSGANTYKVTVRSQDQSLTRVYVLNVTYTPPAAQVLTTTSTISVGDVNPSIVVQTDVGFFSLASSALLATFNGYLVDVGTTGLTRGAASVSAFPNNQTITIPFTGTARAGTLTFQVAAGFRPASNVLSFVVGAATSSSTPTVNASELAAAEATRLAAAEATRLAAIVTAKIELQGLLKIGKAGTLAQYQAADFSPINEKTVDRVNVEVLKLAVADRENADKIKAIIKTENFIEQVSTALTQKSVMALQLVEQKLIPADSRNKASVTSAIKNAPAGSFTTLASVQAVVDAHLASIKARKDRTAAIKAKIAARNK